MKIDLEDEDYDNDDLQPPPAKKRKIPTSIPLEDRQVDGLDSPPGNLQVKDGVKSPIKGKVQKSKKGGGKGQVASKQQGKAGGHDADSVLGDGREEEPTAGEGTDGGEAAEGAKGTAADDAAKEEDYEEGGYSLDLDLTKIPTMNAEKMQSVLEKFTPEQMNRYEAYRRSGLQRSTVKRLVQGVVGHPVNVQMAIVVSGITKIFVGELVETARVVMSERAVAGPIRPSHLREAYRRLKQSNKVPLKTRPTLFH